MPVKISNFFKPSSKFSPNIDNRNIKITQNFEIKQEKVVFTESINYDDQNSNVDRHKSTITSFHPTTKTQKFIGNIKIEPDQEFSIVSIPQSSKIFSKTKKLKSESNENKEFLEVTIKAEPSLSNSSGVQCTYCPKILSQKRKLQEHVLKMHHDMLDNLFECKNCNSKFVKEFKLKLHMKTKHLNENVTQFECDFDGKFFKTKTSIYLHMRTHESSIKCKICQAEIKPRTLLQHMKNVHNDSNFQCEICQKSFKSQMVLKAHRNIHDKRFECKICNKKFPELNRLTRHEREVHGNSKKFECEDCDKKFNTKISLRNHQKVHDRTRPKPFKCQRCNYATDIPQNIKSHQTFHENQDKKFASMKNPIKCDKCAILCRNKDALWMHKRRVHSNITYQCDLCGQYGKIKSNMERHLKIVHMKNKTL